MTFQFTNHSGAKTKFCFLFGKNLLTSKSSKLQNNWFKNHHLNAVYKNYIVHDSHEFIHAIEHLKLDENFLGGNVTMPFKQTLVKHFENAFLTSQSVKNTASSNTLYRDQNGNFQLENTDVIGIQKTLEFLCKNKRFNSVFLYGAGGAAASCAFCLLQNGWTENIVCFARNPDKSAINFEEGEFLNHALQNGTLVIEPLEDHAQKSKFKEPVLILNTMPLGRTNMYPEQNQFCSSILQTCRPEETFFFDLVYDNTDAIQIAKSRGIACQNGELMLVTQAAKSFELWTGIPIENEATASLLVACVPPTA